MRSCISPNIASYFYSFPVFVLLSLCSIFIATLIVYDCDCTWLNIFIWCIIPLIIILFTIEYFMIQNTFKHTFFQFTTCDFVYICSILSMIIELLRITPNFQQQFNDNNNHNIESAAYWKHKLFDALIHFIIFIRIIHAVLRTVLYFIHGKQTKNMYKHNNDNNKSLKTPSTKQHKSGYQSTAINEEGASSESDTLSDESQENEPEPITLHACAQSKYIEIMDDDDDDTAPLPIPNNENNEKQTNIPILTAGRNSVNLYIQSPTQQNSEDTPREKLKLNMNNIMSPPQIDVEPSDVDTHSVERLELFQTFTPAAAQNEQMEIQSVHSHDEDDQNEEEELNENWTILPLVVSKLGIMCICFALNMILFDDVRLLLVQMFIFFVLFLILLYISRQSMLQFIKCNHLSNKLNEDYMKEMSDEQIIQNDDDFLYDNGANASKAKQSLHGILEEFNHDGRRQTDFVKINESTPNTTKFRTGTDDIKYIIRNMQKNINFGSATQEKLQQILSILGDFEVMKHGNIEEQIENDDHLDDEVKQWLFDKVTSHETPKRAVTTATSMTASNNFKITPRFSFNDSMQQTTPKMNVGLPLAPPLIMALSDDLSILSPQKLNAMLSPQSIIKEDIDTEEQKQQKQQKVEFEVDIMQIIQSMNGQNENEKLYTKLQSLSPKIDEYTQKIINLDSSLHTIELNELIGRPLLHCSVCICLKFNFVSELNINFEKFIAFIAMIEDNYHRSNPYHNAMHACEVMMASMIYLDCLQNNVKSMMSPLQIFCAFISAICHDVDHPGNNNAFEINTESQKSLLYSDQSVLEFHHLQFTFSKLKRNEFNFMEFWDNSQKKEFRKQCIYSILATDLSKHFATILHIKNLKMIKESDLECIFKSIIKMSDLSHVTKPLDQHKLWTQRITKEFYNQGDKELAHGLEVSPLCNKANTKIAKGQVGFIKHVVLPLYDAAKRFFDKEGKFETNILKTLSENQSYWEAEAAKEESVISMYGSSTRTRSEKSKSEKMMKGVRPMSATFNHSKAQRFAVLTNLEGTPPPILLPSSVRSMNYSKSTMATSKTRFFSPINMSKQMRQRTMPTPTDKKVESGNAETFKFHNYAKIKGRKRGRSISADKVSVKNALKIGNLGISQTPNFKISDKTRSNEEAFYVKNKVKAANAIKYSKSDILSPHHVTVISPHVTVISSPYSSDATLKSNGDNAQHFKFEGVVEEGPSK